MSSKFNCSGVEHPLITRMTQKSGWAFALHLLYHRQKFARCNILQFIRRDVFPETQFYCELNPEPVLWPFLFIHPTWSLWYTCDPSFNLLPLPSTCLQSSGWFIIKWQRTWECHIIKGIPFDPHLKSREFHQTIITAVPNYLLVTHPFISLQTAVYNGVCAAWERSRCSALSFARFPIEVSCIVVRHIVCPHKQNFSKPMSGSWTSFSRHRHDTEQETRLADIKTNILLHLFSVPLLVSFNKERGNSIKNGIKEIPFRGILLH